MRRLPVGLLVLLISSLVFAQEEKKEDGSGLELTPLVNMKAPLVVLWFTWVILEILVRFWDYWSTLF